MIIVYRWCGEQIANQKDSISYAWEFQPDFGGGTVRGMGNRLARVFGLLAAMLLFSDGPAFSAEELERQIGGCLCA